jgi:quinol monooxygenase YgiN
MRFTQHIVFYADDDDDVLDLVSSATNDASSGLIGGRVLRFREKPGRYVIQADFESLEAAEASNDRPETQEWAERLRAIARSEIKWENLDILTEF